MTQLSFTALEIAAEPYAAAPQLTARLRIEETTGATVHAIALRCQVRIEPQRRPYSDADMAELLGLFGDRSRWRDTLRPFPWMHCAAMVQGFTGTTEVDLPMPCTYDFEVTGSKYLHAVQDGFIPLLLLFSGTVFTRGDSGFAVEQVGWDCEATYQLPVSVWHQVVEANFPGTGWLRLDRDVLHALARYQAAHGLTGWDETISTLLAGSPAVEAPVEERLVNLDRARTVADAVLYEGYLLYPYRASSAKNQVRWQFGVLGPPAAAADGLGEDDRMATQCLVHAGDGGADPEVGPEVTVHLRFLQLQLRTLADVQPDQLSTWEEAVEHEVILPPVRVRPGADLEIHPVTIAGGQDIEPAVVRTRWPLAAEVRVELTWFGAYVRLLIEVQNTSPERARSKEEAIRASLIGAHLLIETTGEFVSLLDPPVEARAAAAECRQHRCWPVLAGPPGTNDVVLVSPIILYDHPEVASESAGALFDSTEIDEILTLRVMTLTEAEKAEARATDPRAAEIIDRCEAMSPEELQRLHGVLRDPHALAAAADPGVDSGLVPLEFAEAVAAVARDAETPWFDTGGQPWWDPAVDERVQPEVDAVVIDGVSVSKGSLVRVHPRRRADAQDLFFADQVARVTAVLGDVDGGLHVALVLVDDPAADLHDWYGRYLYFAPDELEPLPVPTSSRKEHQP